MSNQTKTNNKKFNLTLAPMYRLQSGMLGSIIVTPSMYDAIQQVKVGGKFFVKDNKGKTGDKSPDFYLEYMSPEQIQEFKGTRQAEELKADSL